MATRTDIHSFTYDDAYQWLKDNHVDESTWEDLVSLDELVRLIDSIMSSKDSEEALPDQIPKSQALMQHILAHDKKMKEELTQIYHAIIRFMENGVNKEIQETIECKCRDYKERIAGYQSELSNYECPIVVAGETSAGKSSLLNLILGKDVLPYSLLSATSTICRLHNDSRMRLIVDGQEEHDLDSTDALKEKLKSYVSGRENRENEVNHVDIYWPIPMLPKNVTIVDTPGFGESEQMNERLMKYLPNAVAFIYVINSATAGGVQEDKLLHILNKQKEWDSDNQLFSFDYKCILFVCNKWDQVEMAKEEQKVWDDTIRKLLAVFPELPQDQVFKMCTTEALRYQKGGLGNTEKFDKLLQGIEKMVPQSLKTKLDRHYRWIQRFIGQLQTIINARISHAQSSEEEKVKLHETVTARLNKLNIDSERVKIRLIEKATESCDTIVNNLQEYLHTEDVDAFLNDWNDSDAPDVITDFEVTRYNAEKKIRIRIQEVLKKWESENKLLETVSEELTTMFTTECRLLDQDCKGIDLMIEGVSDRSSFESDAGSPTKEKTKIFTGSEKVILTIAAPLWVPLVAAASILFLPVGLSMIIRAKVKQNKQLADYKANKASFMVKWTKELTEKVFTEASLRAFILDAYFLRFEAKIEELCSIFIPQQIELDRKMINNINQDTSHDILEQFLPIEKNLKSVIGQLYMYRLRYETDDIVSPNQIEKGKKLGSGSYSDVYEAHLMVNGNRSKIALKELRYELKGSTVYTQLKEIDSLRSLTHANIVEFLGVSYYSDLDNQGETGNCKVNNDRGLISGHLSLLFEYCEKNLEQMVFNDKEKQCGHFNSVDTRKDAFQFYVTMVVGICSGLAYIHEKKYMHRDLKLANILVKDGLIPKICDLGFAKEEFMSSGTFVGTITHMSPELLSGKHYTRKTDIYSLGIVLWEFWYGKPAFSDAQFQRYQGTQLHDLIKTGGRPKTNNKFAMTPVIVDIVESCWHRDPAERMEAIEVQTKFKQML